MSTLAITFSTLGFILLAIFLYFIAIRNGIINYKNKVKRSWSDVLVYEQQKNKTIPKLEEITKQFSNYEKDFQSKIVELRNSRQELSEDKIDINKLKEVNQRSEELLKAINITVENYPELKAGSAFSKLMSEVIEQQDNISSAIRLFNNNVEIFNTNIQIFPNNIANNIFNKEDQLSMFKTDVGSESGFTPDFK